MTHDEPKNLVAQGRVILQPTAAKLEHGIKDGVIWPSATAKMNSARCSEERETR